MNQQLLFFFSALGAFNGVIVGLYFLFFSKRKHLSNIFLGCLILVLSLRVGKSVFYYFTDNLPDIYILFGLLACWFIGPFLYFYIKSAISNSIAIKKMSLRVFLPLLIIVLVVMVVYPWSTYIDLWKTHLIKGIYTQWLFFILLAGYELFRHRKKVFVNSNNKPFKIWILCLYLGNLLICGVFNLYSYTPYIIGALSFSFVFYLLTVLLIFHKKRDTLLFLASKKYETNKLNAIEANTIQKDLQGLISKEKVYLNANLNSAQLAEMLQVSSVKLSQTLNEHLGTTFNDFINTHRIDTAKKIILEKDHLTLEAIGLECGFNAKSTFYSAFKKFTGMTPSQFKKQQSTTLI